MSSTASGTLSVISTMGMPAPVTDSAAKCASAAVQTLMAGMIPISSISAQTSARFIARILQPIQMRRRTRGHALYILHASLIRRLNLSLFRSGETIARARERGIHRREEKDADQQIGEKSADDDDGKRALGIGADAVREGGGKQAEGGDEHGHEDGPEAEHGSFGRGLLDGVAAAAKLVDVLDHDDAGLHGHAEQSEKAHAGGDAEVRVREEKGEKASEGSHGDVGEDEQRPLNRGKHGVQDDVDD